ncbi:MAG: hypothetical protein DWI12_04385 [Planctomycetota bacterium]|nr:MAG: hypothetical protein DWI12_04385 [Planctomycetota bacterium]
MANWHDESVWRLLDAEGGGVDGVIAAAASADARNASEVARLRKRFDAALVTAALELTAARRKARGKFTRADTLWCDVSSVEQASSERVAAWKAARIASVLGSGAAIFDVCCGLGGDAMALVDAGLTVDAIDLEPRRAWMTAKNAQCTARAVAAESLDLAGAFVHADPARRDERGGHTWNLDHHQPNRAWIEQTLRVARGGAMKFSPGVDRRALPEFALEWEWISDGASLVQAIAWQGEFALRVGETRATVIGSHATVANEIGEGHERTTIRVGGNSGENAITCHAESLVGIPDDARSHRLRIGTQLRAGEYLSEPIAAVERAQLLTQATLCSDAREISFGLGLLASSAPLRAPWFESFEICGEAPVRADALLTALREHSLTPRSVRVRGAAADADKLTRALGCTPSGTGVVFIFRSGNSARAVITRVVGA